jgi:hypothetical protein
LKKVKRWCPPTLGRFTCEAMCHRPWRSVKPEDVRWRASVADFWAYAGKCTCVTPHFFGYWTVELLAQCGNVRLSGICDSKFEVVLRQGYEESANPHNVQQAALDCVAL